MRRTKRYPTIQIVLFAIAAIALAVYILTSCKGETKNASGTTEATTETEAQKEVPTLYGIDYSELIVEQGTIGTGQTAGALFAKYGLDPAMTDKTDKACRSVFDLRNMRAGNNYTAFISNDSLSQLKHFVYEQNKTEYLVISFIGDSVCVRQDLKDVSVKRRMGEAVIKSSLWNAMVEADMSPALAMELSEVYAWTIDFFGLQEGDKVKVIYDEQYVDSTRIGNGRIWGAIFNHGGKDNYAIPFNQDGRISYWDEKGQSLRKSMLKAPLKYSRISSKFSNSRMHPVLRIRRPHHGVDYAAPAGTPVVAVGDGTVVFKGWQSGGGNVIKIKHNTQYTTDYLHLRGFAQGIATGKRVSQGQVIGYVGSTGVSTGPHLDYRVWRNGTPIDPLKMVAEPAEPISKENMARFEFVRDRIMAELAGTLPADQRITQLDSITVANDTLKTDSIR